MLLRIALFSLIALGLGGFGTVAWISLRGTATATPTVDLAPPPAKATVLAAARPLRAGTLLKPEEIGTADVLTSDMPHGARPDTPADRGALLGAMVRRSLLPGEPMLPADVMRPGDHGFLAAVLGPGMRAVTVGVDAVSGTAGLIWPGDSVDLILTMTLDDPTLPAARRISGETVLHRVRVIAIDQQLMQGANPSGVEAQQARTVTLEVKPSDAEKVQVAVRLGKLSLAVVSADLSSEGVASADSSQGSGVTWGGDVARALSRGGSKAAEEHSLTIQSPGDSKTFSFPGQAAPRDRPNQRNTF